MFVPKPGVAVHKTGHSKKLTDRAELNREFHGQANTSPGDHTRPSVQDDDHMVALPHRYAGIPSTIVTTQMPRNDTIPHYGVGTPRTIQKMYTGHHSSL